jgi:hypothetical protein
MIPFFKILSIIVRTLTRPLVNYTKAAHLSRRNDKTFFLKDFFIWLGNYYNKMEYLINRRFLKLSDKENFYVKVLNEDIAIEKGVEFFYEILAYSVLILLPSYEIWSSYNKDVEKSQKLDDKLDSMEKSIDQEAKNSDNVAKEIADKLQKLQTILDAMRAGNVETEGKASHTFRLLRKEILKDRDSVYNLEKQIVSLRSEIIQKVNELHVSQTELKQVASIAIPIVPVQSVDLTQTDDPLAELVV